MFLMWIPGCSSLIFQLLQDGHIRNEDNSAWRPRYSTDNYQWEVGRSNTSHRVIFLISWHPPPSITNPFSTNLPTREHFQCHSTKYLWIWGPSRPRVAAAAERTVAEDKEISDKLDEVGLGSGYGENGIIWRCWDLRQWKTVGSFIWSSVIPWNRV